MKRGIINNNGFNELLGNVESVGATLGNAELLLHNNAKHGDNDGYALGDEIKDMLGANGCTLGNSEADKTCDMIIGYSSHIIFTESHEYDVLSNGHENV